MFGKRQSYAEAVQGRRRIIRRLGLLFLVFICYELVSGLFLTTFVMESLAQSSTSRRSAAGRAIRPATITIIGLSAR